MKAEINKVAEAFDVVCKTFAQVREVGATKLPVLEEALNECSGALEALTHKLVMNEEVMKSTALALAEFKKGVEAMRGTVEEAEQAIIEVAANVNMVVEKEEEKVEVSNG